MKCLVLTLLLGIPVITLLGFVEGKGVKYLLISIGRENLHRVNSYRQGPGSIAIHQNVAQVNAANKVPKRIKEIQTQLIHSKAETEIYCSRPSSGCTQSYDIYWSGDCDNDGKLDHFCSTTINNNIWMVLSSQNCAGSWFQVSSLRAKNDCSKAFYENAARKTQKINDAIKTQRENHRQEINTHLDNAKHYADLAKKGGIQAQLYAQLANKEREKANEKAKFPTPVDH